MIVNLNGDWLGPEDATVPLDDGSVLFGDSLFETLKGSGGKVRLVKEHLDRLELSCRLLDFPCHRTALETVLRQLEDRLPLAPQRIRLTLGRGRCDGLAFPDPGRAWFSVVAREYREPEACELAQGVDCVFAPNRRINPLSHLPQLKRGNYADCLYAAAHARRAGAREALFREPDGTVLEGATGNLLALHDGVWSTPPTGTLVLAGVMLQQVGEAAAALGLAVRSAPLSVSDLLAADEVLICNSLIGVLPVRSLDGHNLHQQGEASRIQAELLHRGVL